MKRMYLQIFKMRSFVIMSLLGASLAACSSQPDNSKLAAAEAKAVAEAIDDGRISCAMGGATLFDRKCTMDRMTSGDGPVLIVGREEAGFRRLLITGDGRGVVSADGAEPAEVTIIGKDMIEVAIGGDRFRLPADTDGKP
jgi:hypothetical protein